MEKERNEKSGRWAFSRKQHVLFLKDNNQSLTGYFLKILFKRENLELIQLCQFSSCIYIDFSVK